MTMHIVNNTAQDYYFGPLHLPGSGTLDVDDQSATSLYLTSDSVADAINTLAAGPSPAITVTPSAGTVFPRAVGEPQILHGDGNPEGLIYAVQGSMFMSRTAASSTNYLFTKTTGVHLNTGWVALNPGGGPPPGAIEMYAGAAAPAGYILCDGSAVSRTIYAGLFTAISTIYGAGDGSTTFNVPDLRGRVPVGFAASGGHTDVSALANTDGTALASRRPKHKHAVAISDPGHNHTFNNIVGGGNNIGPGTSFQGVTSNTSTSATGISATAGPQTGAEPTDAPAYVVVNYIIKT